MKDTPQNIQISDDNSLLLGEEYKPFYDFYEGIRSEYGQVESSTQVHSHDAQDFFRIKLWKLIYENADQLALGELKPFIETILNDLVMEDAKLDSKTPDRALSKKQGIQKAIEKGFLFEKLPSLKMFVNKNTPNQTMSFYRMINSISEEDFRSEILKMRDNLNSLQTSVAIQTISAIPIIVDSFSGSDLLDNDLFSNIIMNPLSVMSGQLNLLIMLLNQYESKAENV